MKKLLLLASILLFSAMSFSQKRWAVGLSGSVDVTGAIVTNTDYLNFHTVSGIASYSALVHVHYFPTPYFFIKSGIGLYASGYYEKEDLQGIFNSNPGLVYIGSRYEYTLVSTKYLECPLLVGWQSKSKNNIHFYGTVGPSLRLFFFDNYFYTNDNYSAKSMTTIGQIYNKGYNLFGLDGILTAGISIDISPKVSLLIENAVRVNIISNIGDSYSNYLFRDWGEGLKLGIMYYLDRSSGLPKSK